MAIARVVTFEGVRRDHLEEVKRQVEGGEVPEGMPSAEIVILHDPTAERSLAIVFFESEDDYKVGDEILDAMPRDDTPGERTSVTKYDVVARMST